MRVLVVGAGFSGAVFARQIAEQGFRSLVIDARDHVAGNCHTERDAESGNMIHRYGPHIFHTSNPAVWDFVNRFATFRPFVNRVKASIDQGVYSLPINLHTINQFFGTCLNPSQAKSFIAAKADASITEPANFEEQALKFVGQELYEAFFRGYTIKQWGCHPHELPASILKRLPLRFDYNDNYYSSHFQGMPEEGYTTLIKRILRHELIETKLSTPFERNAIGEFSHVVYTGSLDGFYDYSEGELSYRTVYWEKEVVGGDHQGNPVINYPSLEQPWTRIIEHKHFAPWEEHQLSTVCVEFSKETSRDDIPYYPKRLKGDQAVLKRYLDLAQSETTTSFLGRLATYRYMDMHHVIHEAMDFAQAWLCACRDRRPGPVFPADMPLSEGG